MKQLIEEQREKDIAEILKILSWQQVITSQGVAYTGEKDWALNKILDWHKQSFKQFIDELIAKSEQRIVVLNKLVDRFNFDIDKHRIDEVEQYISHLKELKEELN